MDSVFLIPFMFFSGACESLDKHTHHFYHVYPEVLMPTALGSSYQNLTIRLISGPHHLQPSSLLPLYHTPRLFSFPVSSLSFQSVPDLFTYFSAQMSSSDLLGWLYFACYLFLQWNEKNKNFVLCSVCFPKHLNQHLLPIKWMNAFWTSRPSLNLQDVYLSELRKSITLTPCF